MHNTNVCEIIYILEILFASDGRLMKRNFFAAGLVSHGIACCVAHLYGLNFIQQINIELLVLNMPQGLTQKSTL